MTTEPRPWPGEGGELGPVEEGWPAPLDPRDVYVGTSGGPESIEYLMAHPAYDWSYVAELASETLVHHPDDPRWLGTFGDTWGGPTIEQIERIREVFGADVSVVDALRIHRLRRALSYFIDAAKTAEKSHAQFIDALRKAKSLGEIADLLSDEDYEF
jgi:hypothetical protein